MTDLHVVVPGTVHDLAHPSGGNTYDRRIVAALERLGWSVHEHRVPGPWPRPDSPALATLGEVMATVPDGALALVDGLVASCSPEVLVPEALRLRLVVLVHLPLGESWAEDCDIQGGEADDGDGEASARDDGDGALDDRDGALDDGGGSGRVRTREREVLAAASAVVTASEWTRRRLLELYPLDASRVHVAEPGVDPAPRAAGTAAGGHLLCVAAVTPVKGHDRLLSALAGIVDLPWECVCAGALDLDVGWARHVQHLARRAGIEDRVHLVGPLATDALDRSYAAADLLVVASRVETYGMVVTEALARGVPVVAPSVGGLPAALGRAPGGSVPGLLVRSSDPADAGPDLAVALRSWLTDPALRRRLRRSAEHRRDALADWSVTARRVAEILDRGAR